MNHQKQRRRIDTHPSLQLDDAAPQGTCLEAPTAVAIQQDNLPSTIPGLLSPLAAPALQRHGCSLEAWPAQGPHVMAKCHPFFHPNKDLEVGESLAKAISRILHHSSVP